MALEEVYLFTGTEEVRNRTKMERILQNVDQSKTSITRYDADFISIQDIIEDAITIPFLSDKKVIIVKNPRFLTKESSPMKHDPTTFIKYLKDPVDTTVLMIDAVGCVLDKDSEAVKACKKYAYIVDTQELEPVEYSAWVKRSFVLQNVDIEDDALNLLVEYVGSDSLRMEQEVNKLISYVGQEGIVNTLDVKKLVVPTLDDAVMLLVNAIINKDKKMAMKIYSTLSNNTQDVMGIISLLSNAFINLFKVATLSKDGFKQGEIASILGISNGHAYHLMNDIKKYNFETLEENVLKLSKLDYQIKTGQISKELGFEFLLLSM